MNELRLRIYEQIRNDSPSVKTSLFNIICGVTIFISIFFAVIITENSIDYQFGDQIDFLDWIIGSLFCVEYCCRLWVAPLEKIYHFNYAFRSKSQELQISIFYTVILLLISSTFMYLAESSIQPRLLGSIPRCLWWSITTVSAVGYGDSIPVTAVGKTIASITSLMGIAAIAIPTGILASGFSESIGVQDKNKKDLYENEFPKSTE